MTTRTQAIREAIIATLKDRIDGSGSYTNDLTDRASGITAIFTGAFDEPPARPIAGHPVVAIRCVGVESSGNGSTQEFTHAGSWVLDCWIVASTKSTVDRIAAAEVLLDELQSALHSNLSLVHSSTGLSGYSTRNLVDRLFVSSQPFTETNEQQGRNAQAYGRLLAVVSADWRTALPAQSPAP